MFLDTGMLDVRAGWDDVMTLHIDPVHSISEDQTPAQTYYGQEPGQQLGPEREARNIRGDTSHCQEHVQNSTEFS